MAKITDYARQGFRRRPRPWNSAELPEWWDAAAWLGVVAVVVMLVSGAVFADDRSPGGAAAAGDDAPRYAPETLGSPGLGAPPAPGDGSAAPVPPASPPAGVPTGTSAEGFASTAATRVPITGGGTAVVPAGALNVALAAARARATGNWAGIPFAGAERPAPTAPSPHGVVVGEVTVEDPAATGNTQYRFSARIARGGGARPETARFVVELGMNGYAIRAG
ncbi:hypothetical protein [Actinomadura sp. B10D3]|uniref:hypothetical protein n=1 Tax=Actinomadura sp. B10D3 TaxID=3153557 RepID=UPI00325F79F0